MKQLKNAVAFVIYNREGNRILTVLRPPDDKHLPNLWGLPAGSVKKEESFEECVLRSGREKLGVELQIVELIGDGHLEREDYVLYMKEYEVEIIKGKPKVPQPVKGMTQYTKWKWGKAEELIISARKGSLCSQIYLNSRRIKW